MKDRTHKTVRHLTKRQRADLAMILRYRTLTPKRQPYVYATLREIAELLGRSTTWVHITIRARIRELRFSEHAVKKCIEEKAMMPAHHKYKRYTYTLEQKNWLTSPQQLRL